jgi:hypothetical protein
MLPTSKIVFGLQGIDALPVLTEKSIGLFSLPSIFLAMRAYSSCKAQNLIIIAFSLR